MKVIRKTLAVVLVLCMGLCLSLPARAAEDLSGFWRFVDLRGQSTGYIPIISDFIALVKEKISEESQDFVAGLYFIDGTAWTAVGTTETITALKSVSSLDLWGNMLSDTNDICYPLFSYSGTQLYELFSTNEINSEIAGNTLYIRSDVLGGWEFVLERYDLNQPPQREDEIPDSYETIARLRWQSGDFGVLVRPDNVLDDEQITDGVIEHPAYINGEGTYTVSLNFMNTAVGYSVGMNYCSVDVEYGEQLHPGWCINIESVRLNGYKIVLYAQPYTCSDQYGLATQTHLYNAWYSDISESARALGGLNNPSTCPMDLRYHDLQHLQTIEITFTYGPAW